MRIYYEELEGTPSVASILPSRSLVAKSTLLFAILPMVVFCLLTIGIIGISVTLLKSTSSTKSANNNYSLYIAQPKSPAIIEQTFAATDSRSAVLDNYLTSQGAPLAGQGKFLVAMADKYGLDWRLVAAIAMQESNAGKVMPRESFNAWGWAIYTGQNSGTYFDSWEHAIETVSKGLAKYRDSYGLITPEQIMQLYTPDSAANGGSWARGVRYFMGLFAAGQS